MPARHDNQGQVSTSQRKAADKYQRNHIQQLQIKLNIKTDSDIIVFLLGIPNKTRLIKRLLREEIARRSVVSESREELSFYNIAIQDTPLPKRTKNILKQNGIEQLSDLTNYSQYNLWQLPGMGKKCLHELIGYLAGAGVKLRESEMDEYIGV